MSGEVVTPGTSRRADEFGPGQVFETPTLRATLVELSPEAYRSEVDAGPAANGGPLHRHMHQEERFIVHEGALRVRLGLRGSQVVGAGESVTIPRGTPHTFSVVGERARFRAEFEPALRVADYFLELFNLGQPGLRDLARLAQEYPAEHFYAPVVPPAVQRLLLRPLARENRADRISFTGG